MTEPDPSSSAGEQLFERPWQLLKSVPALEFLPPADRIEIAFAGRSNVGKSSLLNALVRQGGLARTSNTPGRTQELNFFQAPDAAALSRRHAGLRLRQGAEGEGRGVDRARVTDYLRGRATLARVFLLIDCRHGLKPPDLADHGDARRGGRLLSGGADQGRQDQAARARRGRPRTRRRRRSASTRPRFRTSS